MDPVYHGEEAKVIKIKKDVCDRAKASYENSLIRKFIGNTPVNGRLIKEAFKGLWCLPDEDLTVVEMKQKNTFLFRFPRREVMNQVTEGGPWVFDNQLLLFKPWKMNDKTDEIHFDEVILWFQIVGLPFHLINDEVGTVVGSTVGQVLRVEARVEGEEKDRFIRVQARVKTDVALPRRSKIETEEDGGDSIWVDFKYEGIPKEVVCTWCGCLNHGLEEYCGRRHTMPAGASKEDEMAALIEKKKMPEKKDDLSAVAAAAAESPLGSSREFPLPLIEKPPVSVRSSHRKSVNFCSEVGRDINMKDGICWQPDEILVQILSLPDEILVQILSLLTLKEAGRSSVISRRWKDLWKLTTSLKFESPKSLDRIYKCHPYLIKSYLLSERSKFVTWVNQVLRLHESPRLNKFRLVFSLDGRFGDDIDQWIKLIIPKRVKIIKICLFRKNILDSLDHYYYGFSKECYRAFKSPANLDNIKCLTSLSLSYVKVDGELIRYLVSNCPHLEKISIAHSHHSSNLKVAGTSVQLKYLYIDFCSFESIELSAPKLVKFRWSGNLLQDFYIGSNPLLSELIFDGGYCAEVTSSLVPFSTHLPQLETLSLSIWFRESCPVIPHIPVLRNLRHLMFESVIDNCSIRNLMCSTKLISAAPFLIKFTLQVQWYDIEPDRGGMGMETEPCSLPHQCLKHVELLGFLGRNCEFDLAKLLAKTAICLEKMVIGLLPPSADRPSIRKDIKNRKKEIREQVKRMLPPRAKLVIKLLEIDQ